MEMCGTTRLGFNKMKKRGVLGALNEKNQLMWHKHMVLQCITSQMGTQTVLEPNPERFV